MAVRPYHHGDLRNAVVRAALDEIDAVGPAQLSLRSVARRAGVSHAAPAHHFGDKEGVLTAIAAEGYALLTEATATALREGDRLRDIGLAYIRFAFDHRAHFAVMFRPELYDAGDDALVRARDAAAAVLFDGVHRALPGASEAEVWGGVVAAWSYTHGVATLAMQGNFDAPFPLEPEAIARLGIEGIEALVRRDAL